MNKQEKIEFIVNFMKGKSFSSQTELVKKLGNPEINQPFISRNMEDIGIEKNDDERYVLNQDYYLKKARHNLKKELGSNDYSISEADFITLKVNEGSAEKIAYLLEESFPEDIIGTINQRNIVLVFLKNEASKNNIINGELNNFKLD